MVAVLHNNAQVFSVLNRHAGRGEIVLRDDIRLKIDEEARIAFEMFCFRHEELPIELDSFLAFSRGKRRLLDVGALFGIFSLTFCLRNGALAQALAIDPSPQAFAVLQNNCHLNPTLPVFSLNIAAGETEGQIHMRSEWLHLVAQNAASSESIQIPCKRMDLVVAETKFIPDVVKIDVEGYEMSVLRGLRETIANEKPDIHIEIHPQMLLSLGETGQDAVNLLNDSGYNCFDMSGNQIKAMEELSGTCLNIYCVHRQGNARGALPVAED